MLKSNRQGVILIIVLGILMIVITLATVILRVISSQSRLTHHQVSRIQAQYAAKAAMVYTLEKLRKNAAAPWNNADTLFVVEMCRSTGGCTVPVANRIIEDALPLSIEKVVVTIEGKNGLGVYTGPYGTRRVNAKAIYTYEIATATP